jgi:endonuclease/exonuclease/phosphatase family metal-dependent hydrolase
MPEGADRDVVIMTANVGAGLAPDEEIIAAVEAESPDIVAFQELPRQQAIRLQLRLAESYPNASFNADGNEGRGILSRFPIVWAHPVEISQGRPDLIALVDVHGQDLFFIVGHPRPQKMRPAGLMFSFGSKRQILRLGEMTTDQPTAVLVGDFNMSPRHPGYRRLEKLGLVDAFAMKGEGSGNTFPTRIAAARQASLRMARQRVPPVVRFDYIFCTPNIEIDASWVGADTGSDHAPVLARVRLPSP